MILAAGASRRLGRPKQEVVLKGETLLAYAVRVACEAGLSPVILVVRRSAAANGLQGQQVRVVINESADEGIASSIRCGIASAEQHGVDGAVMLACDQPGLSSPHLRSLVADPGRLTASAYGGAVGIPAYFPANFFPSLMQLHGDQGARSMLRSAHFVSAEELKLDIDTEDDLDAARALIERGFNR